MTHFPKGIEDSFTKHASARFQGCLRLSFCFVVSLGLILLSATMAPMATTMAITTAIITISIGFKELVVALPVDFVGVGELVGELPPV